MILIDFQPNRSIPLALNISPSLPSSPPNFLPVHLNTYSAKDITLLAVVSAIDAPLLGASKHSWEPMAI